MQTFKLPIEVSQGIEKAFYEVNSLKGILEFIIANQSKVDINLYNFHLTRYNKAYVELEQMKREAFTLYCKDAPANCNYQFNFYDNTIEILEWDLKISPIRWDNFIKMVGYVM